MRCSITFENLYVSAMIATWTNSVTTKSLRRMSICWTVGSNRAEAVHMKSETAVGESSIL